MSSMFSMKAPVTVTHRAYRLRTYSHLAIGLLLRITPAILTRRAQQYWMILGMGGSRWNALRMFFTGRSGKFPPARRRFRDRPTA